MSRHWFIARRSFRMIVISTSQLRYLSAKSGLIRYFYRV